MYRGRPFWSLGFVTALVVRRWHWWKATSLKSQRDASPIGPEKTIHFINELLTYTDLLLLFCFHGFIGVLIYSDCTYLMCDLISAKHNFSGNDEYSRSSQNAICLKGKHPFLSPQFGAESLVRDSADCSGLQPCPRGSMKVRLNPAFWQSLVFPSNKGGCRDWWSLRPPTAQISIKRRGPWA